MAIPYRGSTGNNTYFITASTFEKAALLQSDRMARLLLDVLLHYRAQRKHLLHEFVIMRNHFHLLITPLPPVTLEKAIQFIKGGFSYRARKELVFQGEIWQTSFHDRRVRRCVGILRIAAIHLHESGPQRISANPRGVPLQFSNNETG